MKINKNIKNEMKVLGCAALAGIVFTLAVTMSTKVYATNIQKNIASNVVRFHVRANSDSKEDQTLKIKIKDHILKTYKGQLSSKNSMRETKKFITNNIDNIKVTAENEIRSQGYNYSATVRLDNEYFPTKYYGNISLPPGEYEALVIEIGEGKGDNWWCVMFPPLCYVDATEKKVSEDTKEQLSNVLTEDGYNLISSEDSTSIKIKFKIVEYWNKNNKKEKEIRDKYVYSNVFLN